MYRLIICFVIAISAVPTSRGFSDYVLDPDRLEYDGLNFAINPTNCTKPGPICDGCDKRYECIEIGIDDYLIIALDPCPNGTTCRSGVCTANPNPDCHTPPNNGYKFECHQVGLFPDAFDCQKYHLCVPEVDVDPGTTTTTMTSDIPTSESSTDSESSTVSDVSTPETSTNSESSTVSDVPTSESSTDSESSTVSDVLTSESSTDLESSTASDVPTSERTTSLAEFDSDNQEVPASSRAVNSISVEFYCDFGFYFDPRTALCRKKMINGTCPAVTGPCNALGDVGVIASNPALYYICLRGASTVTLFPQIFACRDNLEYDVKSRTCLDPTPISGMGSDGKTCLAAGLFADSGDCSHYKECSRIGAIAISKACPTRTYFDPRTSACAEFTCADLEKNKNGHTTKVAGYNNFLDNDWNSDYLERPLKLTEENCTKPGPICQDCYKRSECIEIGLGDYILVQLGSCENGTTCLASSGVCTANANPDCVTPPTDGYKFDCHQVGLFPDAQNCQKYHLCVPENVVDPVTTTTETPVTMESGKAMDLRTVKVESIEYFCGDNFYYDPRTTLCRKKMINGTCPAVTGPCNALGDVGVIASNPALYYICLGGNSANKFFPQMFACRDNLEYDVKSRSCLDPTPISGTGSDGKTCLAAGLFADSGDCFHYKECSALGAIATPKSCPTRTHFNPKTSACVEFTCADLDK